MKEEDNIRSKVGSEDGFNVPDNYFESFTSKLMDNLPEQNEEEMYETRDVSRWEKVKPWVYMAASFIGIAFIIQTAMYLTPKPSEETDNGTTIMVASLYDDLEEEGYIDYVLDASMMDDYEMYLYLAETETE